MQPPMSDREGPGRKAKSAYEMQQLRDESRKDDCMGTS